MTADRSGDVGRESVRQQLGDERARDEHALVDVEAEFAEPRLVRQIRGRHAFVDAPREQRAELAALGLRQLRIEERLEAIERQMQRVQQQVRSLVVRVGGRHGRTRAPASLNRDTA